MTNIVVKNLTKKFLEEKALDDVSLEFEKGKIYGLLGPNASGKTTLIKLINGLLIPTSGSVSINNKAIGAESKRIISYMPDRLNIISSFKVSEAVK